MAKHLKTRRDALREIVGTLAAAAALTSGQIAELLAQVKKIPDLVKLRSVQTTDGTVKALKIMLAPRAQAAQVFESEFGRKPALTPMVNPKTGKATCPAYLGSGGACEEFGCTIVVCNGFSSTTREQHCPTVDFANTTAGCAGATGNLQKGSGGGFPGDINSQWLRARQSDPYIKALMGEFGVNKAEALEAELTKILADRRAAK